MNSTAEVLQTQLRDGEKAVIKNTTYFVTTNALCVQFSVHVAHYIHIVYLSIGMQLTSGCVTDASIISHVDYNNLLRSNSRYALF